MYIQPAIIEPAAGDNLSDVCFAIQQFGQIYAFHVFPSTQHVWRASDDNATDDGRHERGEPVVINARALVQPNTQKRGRGVLDTPGAGHVETQYIVHLDARDPVNVQAVAAHVDIFPDGFRLTDFDDTSTAVGANFPMALVFDGRKFKLKQPLLFPTSDGAVRGPVYRAECQLWADVSAERDARGDAPTWGPRA